MRRWTVDRPWVALLVVAGCGRLDFDDLDPLDAVGPPPACGRFAVARPDPFAVTSPTFTPVPGSDLDVSVPAGETWLVWVSASLRSTSISSSAVEARLVVDGVARATNGVQNEIADHPLSWLYFDRLPEGDHHVAVELHDLSGTATIENLHLVAFPAPVVHWDERPEEILIGQTEMDVLATTAQIPVAGSYLVFAATSASEAPTSSSVHTGLRDPSGAIWPEDSSERYFNFRPMYLPAIWARRVDLPAGPAAFAIYGSSGSTSTIRDTRLAIMRASSSDLDGEALAPISLTTNGTTTLATLDVPAATQRRDRIVIQAFTSQGNSGSSTMNPVLMDLLRDGVAQAHYENWSPTLPVVPSGYVDAFTTSAAMRFENAISVADATRSVQAKEAVIHVLDTPCL